MSDTWADKAAEEIAAADDWVDINPNWIAQVIRRHAAALAEDGPNDETVSRIESRARSAMDSSLSPAVTSLAMDAIELAAELRRLRAALTSSGEGQGQ